jgi:nucleolar protein 16
MGGSRRRLKRNAPKVKVGVVKRKKNSKAQVPVELLEQRQDLEKRLNTRWAATALLLQLRLSSSAQAL